MPVVMMGARAASLLSDGVVLALTAVKMLYFKKRASASTRGSMVTDVMLRDSLCARFSPCKGKI